MNKNNAKEYLPLVQALADGKTIQYESLHEGWRDIRNPLFNGMSEYRIKPEPREYNVYLNASEQPFDVTHAMVDTKQGMRTVRVREVTE